MRAPSTSLRTGLCATRALQTEQFTQAFGLGPAHRDSGLLFVVHAKLVGTLEPGDDFLDAVDVHQVGAVGAPEEIGDRDCPTEALPECGSWIVLPCRLGRWSLPL